METTSIIIILAIILFILIALNHIKISQTTVTTTQVTKQASCSQTTFGCCPDGVNSKINYYGTNCPGYNPGPGYKPTIIGGCSGTQYGCCPDNRTAKVDPQGSNCFLK